MNKMYRTTLTVFSAALLMVGGQAMAAEVPEDHAEISGPFATPMDVTRACLECHEDAASEVMRSSHWTWAREQELEGKGKVVRGKKNAINNFCISIKSNWPRCTSCHVGYGWKDDTFDFTDESRVDCLACHDTTGTYNKAKDAPAGAGMPAGYTGNPKFDKKPVDLVKVAQNAGKPSRLNCLICHANGGGGNNVKHGDIDMSLVKPSKEIDVHMAADGNNFACQECHATEQHNIKGNALLVSPGGDNPVNCTDCHDAAPHKNSPVRGTLNKHAKRVACQTCHIPFFAKKDATKMSWDWSKAQDPKTLPKDKRIIKEHGHKVYIFKKGKFVYEQKVMPTYAWYNGKAGAYQLGDRIDPTVPTKLNYPLGSKDDPDAKLMPFKVHKGNQIYDTRNKYLIVPKVWGPKGDPDAYWVNFDWKKAAAAGMKAAGLKFSGEYGFAPTLTYWPINHQVSPAKDALRCRDCHGPEGRMDWKALGYEMDPKDAKLKRK
ncbi:cytochrome c [Desulfolithobacter dissulfuricans]|uniref:Cytochrome c n=1 Tax=Desulfolithobacter dissulfuricans TaxID=2795293 RepID=A0A915U473_9BACT|nr:tetrathionate reductase family octaheme c-type cytochrome [Desulfolithobacter dissulfuricans]BCO10457.1 cytochrome c [Desulfolithobacter dissulfuricans]